MSKVRAAHENTCQRVPNNLATVHTNLPVNANLDGHVSR